MPLFYFRTRFSLEHKKEEQCSKNLGNQNLSSTHTATAAQP